MHWLIGPLIMEQLWLKGTGLLGDSFLRVQSVSWEVRCAWADSSDGSQDSQGMRRLERLLFASH